MTRFQTLLAAAALAGSAAVQAQVNPSIYGLIDVAAGRFQSAGAPRLLGLESGGMTTSFIGIAAARTSAAASACASQLESFLRADNGAAGRFDGDPFFGRESFVGLQGGFGSTVLGRNPTPLYRSTVSFNPFGDSFGFSPSVRQYYLGSVLGDRAGTTRWPTPTPTTARCASACWPIPAPARPARPAATIGASLFYVDGPFAATVALQRVRNSALALPPGFDKQDA